MPTREYSTYRFLGIGLQALDKEQLLEVIHNAVDTSARNCIVGNHNLHSLYLVHNDEEMREFYTKNHFTHVDGMGIVVLAKLLGVPLRRRHRNGYLDWFNEFADLARKNSWRVFFLGGRPEVAAKIPAYFSTRYPGLNIRVHHGYDAFELDTTVYREIEEFAPHVLMVGMGMPLQERWISRSLDRLNVNVLLPCGAIMDYYMGAQKPAPRWVGQIGLEWLYRLLSRPRSLCYRYLVEPVKLFPVLLREWKQRRVYADERHG